MFFKDHLLQAQEWSIPIKGKVRMARGLHRWTSLTIKLKYKNKAYKKWKQGQETWEDTKHAEMELWKSKAIWSQIWSGTWRATRIISIGNQQKNQAAEKMGLCWMGQRTWWIEHDSGQHTHCLLCFSLYCPEWPSWNPGPSSRVCKVKEHLLSVKERQSILNSSHW